MIQSSDLVFDVLSVALLMALLYQVKIDEYYAKIVLHEVVVHF